MVIMKSRGYATKRENTHDELGRAVGTPDTNYPPIHTTQNVAFNILAYQSFSKFFSFSHFDTHSLFHDN
jgi:hypothetical protein